MERHEAPRLVKALTELALTIGADFPASRHLGYVRALADRRIEALEFACGEAARLFRFMPAPVELLELSRQYRPPQPAPKMLPDLTPPDVARQRLRGIFEQLNGKFGTRLTVGGDS